MPEHTSASDLPSTVISDDAQTVVVRGLLLDPEEALKLNKAHADGRKIRIVPAHDAILSDATLPDGVDRLLAPVLTPPTPSADVLALAATIAQDAGDRHNRKRAQLRHELDHVVRCFLENEEKNGTLQHETDESFVADIASLALHALIVGLSLHESLPEWSAEAMAEAACSCAEASDCSVSVVLDAWKQFGVLGQTFAAICADAEHY